MNSVIFSRKYVSYGSLFCHLRISNEMLRMIRYREERRAIGDFFRCDSARARAIQEILRNWSAIEIGMVDGSTVSAGGGISDAIGEQVSRRDTPRFFVRREMCRWHSSQSLSARARFPGKFSGRGKRYLVECGWSMRGGVTGGTHRWLLSHLNRVVHRWPGQTHIGHTRARAETGNNMYMRALGTLIPPNITFHSAANEREIFFFCGCARPRSSDLIACKCKRASIYDRRTNYLVTSYPSLHSTQSALSWIS